jgi:hypothetical protein
MFGISADITARKRVDAALGKSEERPLPMTETTVHTIKRRAG